MPTVSAKQEKLMLAVAHGFHPTDEKGPSVKVAKEFVRADEAEGKVKAHHHHTDAEWKSNTAFRG